MISWYCGAVILHGCNSVFLSLPRLPSRQFPLHPFPTLPLTHPSTLPPYLYPPPHSHPHSHPPFTLLLTLTTLSNPLLDPTLTTHHPISPLGIPTTALREIVLLRQLEHPNVVKLENVVMDPARLYLVFELVDTGASTITVTLCMAVCDSISDYDAVYDSV